MNISRRRSCDGKVRHRNFRGALKALAGTGRATGDLSLLAYRCGFCGGWHVGHPHKRMATALKVTRMCRLIDQALAS